MIAKQWTYPLRRGEKSREVIFFAFFQAREGIYEQQ
jgi:hypothetical protein